MSELTTSTQQLDKAFNLKEELRKLKHDSVKTFLRIGYILHVIEEEKLYRQLGHETFASFISDPDIGYSDQTCKAYKNVYRYYVLHLKLAEDEIANIPVFKLNTSMATLKKLDDKEVKEEWIPKLQNLSSGDLMEEFKDKKLVEDKPYIKRHKYQEQAKWQLGWDIARLGEIVIWDNVNKKFVQLAIVEQE